MHRCAVLGSRARSSTRQAPDDHHHGVLGREAVRQLGRQELHAALEVASARQCEHKRQQADNDQQSRLRSHRVPVSGEGRGTRSDENEERERARGGRARRASDGRRDAQRAREHQRRATAGLRRPIEPPENLNCNINTELIYCVGYFLQRLRNISPPKYLATTRCPVRGTRRSRTAARSESSTSPSNHRPAIESSSSSRWLASSMMMHIDGDLVAM